MDKSKLGKIVFLEYSFLMDDTLPFAHLYEFEQMLGDFFAAYGLEARPLKVIAGYEGRRLIFVTKAQMMEPLQMKKPEKQLGPQKALKKLKATAPKK